MALKGKDELRDCVWNLLQENRVARFPGPRGRIPNFVGSEKCAANLSQLTSWQRAKTIKVNPDSPQRAVRQKALEEGKTLYMAVPRLQEVKPFIELDPKKLEVSPFHASSIKGAAKYGRPVAMEEIPKIHLIVCGSVAVNRNGARVGKGGGYSDLEYALLREDGKVDAATPIITTVHPLQLIPGEIPMTEHDIPLNTIVTPEKLISLHPRNNKPRGIYWTMISQEKIDSIPVMRARRSLRKGSR